MKDINEEKFIKDNEDLIKEILSVENSFRLYENKYKELRKKLCKRMTKFGIKNIRIPVLNIRLQINGGRCSGRINRRKLEKKYPDAFYDCLEFPGSCDEYVMVYSINKKLKKGINLDEVLK